MFALIFIPMAYDVDLTGSISKAFFVLVHMFFVIDVFGFASLLATIETRFDYV